MLQILAKVIFIFKQYRMKRSKKLKLVAKPIDEKSIMAENCHTRDTHIDKINCFKCETEYDFYDIRTPIMIGIFAVAIIIAMTWHMSFSFIIALLCYITILIAVTATITAYLYGDDLRDILYEFIWEIVRLYITWTTLQRCF